jgi:2-desacetyl-2-hydroxyethyl bacteriochlorophyllide A dehydrogenase
MHQVVEFSGPREVRLVPEEPQPLKPGTIRVRTWYSGISAGTELTAYRGTNPYLTKTWDPIRRLFVEGAPTFGYPVTGWGYEEVGQVVEVADDVTAYEAGQLVAGIWGHRSEAVIDASAPIHRPLPAGVDPMYGIFARPGAIALNAVLAADVRLGETVAVFGQGVIGLLATQLAALSGGQVTAVDAIEGRLELATKLGAVDAVSALHPGGSGDEIRKRTGGGTDSAIELSGSYRALHEAIRSVQVEGKVAAAGFYQGDGVGLRLGEEFHHNRVQIVASQISGTPIPLGRRWDQPRLVRTFLDQVASGRLAVGPLISHVVDADDVADAFTLLDEHPAEALQVVLRFPASVSSSVSSSGSSSSVSSSSEGIA